MLEKPKTSMQWSVVGVSAFILITTVIVSLFKENINVEPAFYLFTAIAGLVFGASILRKWHE